MQKANDKPMILSGSVDFKTEWNLRTTAEIVSASLFADIPFTEEMSGLREEVPAVALSREIFGLTFVLHGGHEDDGNYYTLEAMCGKTLLNLERVRCSKVDIGSWLAKLVESIPHFKIQAFSPIQIE